MKLYKSEVKVRGKIEAHYYFQCGYEYMMSIFPEEIKVIEDQVTEYILIKGGKGDVMTRRRLTGERIRLSNWYERGYWAILYSKSSPPRLKKRLLKICEKWAGAAYDY